MTGFAIILDGPEPMRAARVKGQLQWVPLTDGEVSEIYRPPPKVVPCACGTMKPAGAKYHAPLLRERDAMVCEHNRTYWSDCQGRIPPPCCWEGER